MWLRLLHGGGSIDYSDLRLVEWLLLLEDDGSSPSPGTANDAGNDQTCPEHREESPKHDPTGSEVLSVTAVVTGLLVPIVVVVEVRLLRVVRAPAADHGSVAVQTGSALVVERA